MALMLSKTYDALLAAGAPEDKARDAAEEIAACENRLTRIETDIALIKADLTSFRGEMRQTMATKTWVLSAMLAQTLVILGGVAGLLKLLH
jgi:phage shock protein A